MPKPINLNGKRFGLLVGLRYAGSRPRGGAIWKFACDCGNIVDIDAANVRYGKSKSCGCLLKSLRAEGLRTTHGKSHTSAYNIWSSMKQRCENTNCRAFEWYGKRGIKVCDTWQTFENFYADMGDPPAGMTLDRIDNDGGYAKANCRWASDSEQALNKRTTLWVEYEGVNVTLKHLADVFGLPYKSLHHRYRKGKRGSELVAAFRSGGNKGAHLPDSRPAMQESRRALERTHTP